MNAETKASGKLLGNVSLVSKEEETVAAYLRKKNLQRTNATSEPVRLRDTMYTRVWKRVLDLVVAIPCCLLLLPLNMVFALLTYLDVGRPIFYLQTRSGRNNAPFTMCKFRNMNNKTDGDGRLLPAAQRITKFGRIMRKYSLDELLNFWNVLKGDMSLIGPRPMPVFIVERMSDRHMSRLNVRPGLECPRVVACDTTQVSAWQGEFENAVWYVENISFKTDVMLVFKLIEMTLSIGKRSKNTGGLSYFVGYDDACNATTVKRLKQEHADDLDAVLKNA